MYKSWKIGPKITSIFKFLNTPKIKTVGFCCAIYYKRRNHI